MSVVLHEGVVLTPRNLDRGARRSVPSICPRSGRPARSAELIGFRVCIIGMTGAPRIESGNQTIQLLSLSSQMAQSTAIYKVWARAAFVARVEPGASMRSICKAAIRPKFADVECHTASPGWAASARLEGPEGQYWRVRTIVSG
jgi:hypothetical protein